MNRRTFLKSVAIVAVAASAPALVFADIPDGPGDVIGRVTWATFYDKGWDTYNHRATVRTEDNIHVISVRDKSKELSKDTERIMLDQLERALYLRVSGIT